MASIVTAVDPKLRELVRLASPARTASALVATTLFLSLAVLVQLVAPAWSMLAELREQSPVRAAQLAPMGWWSAAVLLVLASLASFAIAPRSEALLRAEWGRRRQALEYGLLLWALATALLPPALGWRPGAVPSWFVMIVTTAWQLLSALAPLWGMRAIVAFLGRRCQRWREARQGRQSVDSLLAAAAGVLVFSTAVPILADQRLEFLLMLAKFLAVACGAILAFGLAYLVMNNWWIARSLVRPPALLGEMVDSA